MSVKVVTKTELAMAGSMRMRSSRSGTKAPAKPATMRLADMASAIREDRPHRASGELAFHVLDVMAAFEEAGIQVAKRPVEIAELIAKALKK